MLVRRSQDVNTVVREDRLSKLLQEEGRRKKLESGRGVTRHSRFGTTVVIENVRAHRLSATSSRRRG